MAAGLATQVSRSNGVHWHCPRVKRTLPAGDDAAREPGGHLAGGVHGGRRAAQAGGDRDVLPPRAAAEEAGRRQLHAPGGALWPGASVNRGLCRKAFAMTLFLWRHTLAGVPELVWAGSAQLRSRMACIIQTARGADPRILAFAGDGVWQMQALAADTGCLGPSS